MVGQHRHQRADTALVAVGDTPTVDLAMAEVIVPDATVRTASAPRTYCVAPLPARRPGAPLPALGGEFLSAALDLLRRDEPLSRAEIGDHADVVAEVADALAAVADRLVRDLDALGSDAAGSCGQDLAGARDALQEGSSDSRRGAAMLWARHIAELRATVERARGEVGAPVAPAAGALAD